MAKVFIKEATYQPEKLKAIIGEMLESQGPGWIGTGTRVLVKPNMLMPARPDQAIVTHPAIVRAVVTYLLDKGAAVQVSDSQGVGSFRKI